MAIVLGADLSYTRTGLVWLNTGNMDVLAKAQAFPQRRGRLNLTYQWFVASIGKPDFCVLEDLAYAAPSRTVVVKLAELGAVFKAVLEREKIDYLCISPSRIKKHLTGKGTADKDMVARELKRLHGIAFVDDKGHDLSDAAACAVYGMDHLAKKVS